MKLIFAVLDVSLTMGLTRCYKTEGFFTFIKSNNDDFAGVVKDMYRLVQIGHHGDNWSQLP